MPNTGSLQYYSAWIGLDAKNEQANAENERKMIGLDWMLKMSGLTRDETPELVSLKGQILRRERGHFPVQLTTRTIDNYTRLVNIYASPERDDHPHTGRQESIGSEESSDDVDSKYLDNIKEAEREAQGAQG